MQILTNTAKTFITDALVNNVNPVYEFVFANVQGQDHTLEIDPDEAIPSDDIVWQGNASKVSKISDDKVVFSLFLSSNLAAEFDYNYIALTADGVPLVISHVKQQSKVATSENQIGNNITRNFIIQHDSVAAALQIDIAAESWQFDWTDHILSLIDSREKLRPVVVSAEILGDTAFNGWVASLKISDWPLNAAYYFFNEQLANIRFYVQSQGFDESGNMQTVLREIHATEVLRLPYPNETARDETTIANDISIRFALSEPVFKQDIVYFNASSNFSAIDRNNRTEAFTAVSSMPVFNRSTRLYESVKPLAKWSMPGHHKVGAVCHLECVVAGYFPKDAKQAAAVRFSITGQASNITVSQIVNTMTISSWRDDQYPVIVFEADIDTTALTNGEIATARFEVLPNIGDQTSVFDTNDYTDNIDNEIRSRANLSVLIDHANTLEIMYSCVDSVTGDDATGIASVNLTDAENSPFATIAAAMIQARTNAVDTKTEIITYLRSGTHVGLGADAVKNMAHTQSWKHVTRHPDDDRSTVIYQDSTQHEQPDLFHLFDVTIQVTGILFDGLDTVASKRIWLDQLDWSGGSGGLPALYRIGCVFMTEINAQNTGGYLLRYFSNVASNHALVRGLVCNSSLTIHAQTLLGCDLIGGISMYTAGDHQRNFEEIFIAFNQLRGNSSGAAMLVIKSQDIDTGRLAVLQNCIEVTNSTSPLISLSADNDTGSFTGSIVSYNTFAGARANMYYNDTGTSFVLKDNLANYFNIFTEYNIKRDTFDAPVGDKNANRIGNWYVSYGVNNKANLIIQATSANDLSPSANSWMGDYLGDGSQVLLSNPFVDDKSSSDYGDSTGDGDYRLVQKSVVSVGENAAGLPFDLDGVDRLNDGTGSVGAFEK